LTLTRHRRATLSTPLAPSTITLRASSIDAATSAILTGLPAASR
jgi:hypothetical protein